MYTITLQIDGDSWYDDVGVRCEALVDGEHDATLCCHGARAKPLQVSRAWEAAEVQGVVMQYSFGLSPKGVVMVGVQVGLLYEQHVWAMFRDEGLEVQDIPTQILNVESDECQVL